MWPLLITLCCGAGIAVDAGADTTTRIRIAVAPAETLVVQTAGSGPVIVFLPGLFGSAFGFRKVVPEVTAKGFQVVIIEPLAVGGSSRPPKTDYSLTAQARRISQVLDTLRIDHAVIVAHSLSSAIALHVAVQRPQQVRALVLIEGGPTETAASPGFKRAMQYAPWVKWAGGVRTIQKVIRHSLTGSSGDPGWVTDEVIAEYTAGASADLDGTLLVYLAMARSKEPEQLRPHLPEIRCPIRVLLGGAQHAGGPDSDEMRRLVAGAPDVAVDTVGGAGHYLHEERPDRVVRTIVAVAELTSNAVPIAAKP